MLFRFCLYGFLKNQIYFEPFLLLAFLERGVSFTVIGVLIGFREICVNIMEIPSGAAADNFGRRGAMILSFIAYVCAFLTFGLTHQPGWLFPAMFLFSIGEAFRSGTHKAIIFAWLDKEGRSDEKTRIYGYTRSWSKIGSLVSVFIAAALVVWQNDYRIIFLACIPPYLINIINFLGYPAYVDPVREGSRRHLRDAALSLWRTLKRCISNSSLRRVLLESMSYESIYKVTKDYLQPLIRLMVASVPVIMYLNEKEQTAVLIAVVYGVMYLLSSVASRNAHTVADRFPSPQAAARFLWVLTLMGFLLLGAGILIGWIALAIIAFVALTVVQNFWRPVLVGRCAALSERDATATVLSVDAQTRAVFAAVLAPLIGWGVDVMAGVDDGIRFLPVAVVGIIICSLYVFFIYRGEGKT